MCSVSWGADVVVVVVENGKTYFPSRIKNLPFRLQTSYKSQGRAGSG